MVVRGEVGVVRGIVRATVVGQRQSHSSLGRFKSSSKINVLLKLKFLLCKSPVILPININNNLC